MSNLTERTEILDADGSELEWGGGRVEGGGGRGTCWLTSVTDDVNRTR